MIGIVVPTRTDAYARRLLRSLETCEPDHHSRYDTAEHGEFWPIVFVENGLSLGFKEEVDDDALVIPNSDPFVFARAVNLGVAALDPRADILIMNDDAVFCSPNPIAKLEALLDEQVDTEHRVRDRFGIIGPRIEGGVGNPDQNAALTEDQVLETDKAICFVAALIPRAVWNEVGPLDETLVGYGMDDVDWDRRAVNAGYKLGVTGAATVRHVGNAATGEMHGSYSQLGREEHTRLYSLNQRLYADKWGESGRGDITKEGGK